MDLSKIEAVERLQAELIDLQRPPALDEGVITLEADEGSRQPDEMVAVGYGLEADGSVTIQLRVKTGAKAPLQQAAELVEKAKAEGYSANLLRLEEATIPTRGQVQKTSVDKRMVDPARVPHLGVSISHTNGMPGSLGAFVYFQNKLAILSASHVIARSGGAKVSDIVHQPGAGDIIALSPATIFGSLEDFTILTGETANTIDAAIAVLKPECVRRPKSNHNVIPLDFENCPVKGQKLCEEFDARQLTLGTRVGKIGRTTGYTEGIVTAVSLAHLAITNPSVKSHQIAFKNLIEVTWDCADPVKEPFAAPGDSGAVYFTLKPLQAVGIHIVSGKLEDGTCVSYGCHLLPALRHFGCKLVPD